MNKQKSVTRGVGLAIGLAGAWLRRVIAGGGLLLAVGCATVPAGTVNDPFESFNRSMFSLNEGLDNVVLKPAATVYRAVTPSFVRTAVSNFFSNLSEPWVAVNAALQLKGQAATETVLRFAVNTVLGLGGVLDIASDMNLERRYEDFGQTLGFWGANAGPYLVLPFFGPSTVRDGMGLVVDFQGDPVTQAPNITSNERTGLSVLRLVSFRESLLRAGNLLDEAALDKYTFSRDIYLQRRQALVFDGQEPPENAEPPAK
jgi:phospholipid-binding lipoprotein MlaA